MHKVFKGDVFEKRIERMTLTQPGAGATSDKPDSPAAKMRENIVRRAALEFKVHILKQRPEGSLLYNIQFT